ncbi:Sugar transporter STL1 [Fusarium oxysporum f. sp. albedinis]|nr:Sugar transporter STL1 [Fusarium oxysporum f. sp. albedinis]
MIFRRPPIPLTANYSLNGSTGHLSFDYSEYTSVDFTSREILQVDDIEHSSLPFRISEALLNRRQQMKSTC